MPPLRASAGAEAKEKQNIAIAAEGETKMEIKLRH